MKISLNWLKRYIDIDISIDKLVETLNQIGIEVESVEKIGLIDQNTLVVGEILEICKHPNADKLSVCKVKINNNETKQIVCGAKNFKLHDKVPVALPCTILPDNSTIAVTILRGVQSEGMMCSGRELGFGSDHSGLLILPNDAPVGKEISKVLGINSDVVFDLSITANRGDYLSYIGIARALAAKLDLTFSTSNIKKQKENSHKSSGSLIKHLTIDDSACKYYTLWSIKNITVCKSPDWLIKDLENSGFRSVNNVVDVTNWVMLETGQPLHAMDADKIAGETINVRFAKDNEQISTLDHTNRKLNQSVIVIADTTDPIAIAGIIGGTKAEITEQTRNVILESAHFEPNSIRRTSIALGISTDSSYRFARDVDPNMVNFAAHRAIEMLVEICSGEVIGNEMVFGKQQRQAVKIDFDPKFIPSYCGYEVDVNEAKNIFEKLGFEVIDNKKNWLVTIPTHRNDISRDVDLVEEYLQIHGTDNFETTYKSVEYSHRENDKITDFTKKTGDYLTNLGFHECYNYSLRHSSEIEKFSEFPKSTLAIINNPLLNDQDYYRFSVIPGLIDSLCFNTQNGNVESKFFEIGRVAIPSRGTLCECLSVSFLMTANDLDKNWHTTENANFYTTKALIIPILKELVSTKTIKFNAITDNKMWSNNHSANFGDIATIGVEAKCGLWNVNMTKTNIKTSIYAGEIIINLNVFDRKKSIIKYKKSSQFPRITKDVAIIVDQNLKAGDIQAEIEKIASQTVSAQIFIENVKLFDIYTGKNINENKKSLAFAIDYRSNERTLTDTEVQTSFEKILKKLEEKYEIRKS